MKLELKHLAPYLPYGLEVDVFDGTKIMCGLNASAYKDSVDLKYWTTGDDGDGYYSQRPYGIEICKPLLFPLSYLTKKITVDGKTFVPMVVLFSVDAKEEKAFEVYGKIPDYWKTVLGVGVNHWEFWQVKKLYEWHFDIENLIEQNLAIDKTTINQ